MTAIRSLVLRTAGINCDGETVRALELAGSDVDLVHLARVLEEPGRLDDVEVLVVPGGFSYGDYLAAGRVLGSELRHGLSDQLTAFVARGGFVLGICNGFQVLLEAGLFEPGEERGIALTDNASDRFECRWTTLRSEDSVCPWLVPGELTPTPVAHAEGRFQVRDDSVLARLEANRQIALRYVTADGGEASYPDCPNGSVGAIAGICDPTGRVLGLMPHPERNLTPWAHPHWTRLGERQEGEGLSFYRRLVQAAEAGVRAAGSAC